MKRPHKQGRAVLGMTTGRWRVQYVTDKGRSVALENLFLCKNCEVLEGPEGKRARLKSTFDVEVSPSLSSKHAVGMKSGIRDAPIDPLIDRGDRSIVDDH